MSDNIPVQQQLNATRTVQIKHIVIGIDLGTTNCAIAKFNPESGRAEVVRDEQNNASETVASMVAVGQDDNDFEIGSIAAENFSQNFRETAYEFKRFMGLTVRQMDKIPGGFNRFATDVTYRLEAETDGQGKELKERPPKIVFRMGDEMPGFEAWQISSFLLKHLRKLAEEYLKEGEERVCCESAVITVPAYFLDEQKTATRRAAVEAGFKNVFLLSEPVAAAYNYGLSIRGEKKKENDEYTIFVFDQGGGTTDLSIIYVKDGVYEERYFSGDPNFGGRDFDAVVVRNFNMRIMEEAEQRGLDGSSYDVFLQNRESIRYSLRECCIKLKMQLSSKNRARVFLRDIFEERNYPLEMSRLEFESAEVCGPLFDHCLKLVREFLNDANMGPDDFNVVLFMGGSTRMPAYRRMFTEQLGFASDQIVARELDTGVAKGASIYAAQKFLEGEEQQLALFHGGTFPKSISQALSLPIGIRTVDPNNVDEDVCNIVFPAGTVYPASVEREFATDGMEYVEIEIMENHRYQRGQADVLPMVGECRRLCSFQAIVSDLRAQGAALLIRFELNEDRVLSVHALNAVTKKHLAEYKTESLRDTAGVNALYANMNL